MNVKGVTHGPGPMFSSKKVENRPKKRCPFKAPENYLAVVQAKEAFEIISRVSREKWLKMDTWRSDAFLFRR